MLKVALVTTTRAEFGLFYWLIKALEQSPWVDFRLLVTGMHLAEKFGNTYQEIEAQGITIAEKIDIGLTGESALDNALSCGRATQLFAKSFSDNRPDVVIMMGDRFELLGIANAACILNIPIAHFSGGEITEGIIDDQVRHSVTKLSYWHFVSNEAHLQRVLQLGEEPERVFNVGEPGLDHFYHTELLSLAALAQSIDFALTAPFILCTYHPVTHAKNDALNEIKQVTAAIEALTEYQFIITYPNADEGNDVIVTELKRLQASAPARIKLVESLGFKRYLSALKNCALVLGNSSSGLVEAPMFNKANVNIGERQKGRLRATSCIDVAVKSDEIIGAVQKAASSEHHTLCLRTCNPYGDGKTVDRVMQILKTLPKPAHLSKKFMDISL